MTAKTTSEGRLQPKPADPRLTHDERLKRALKANLARRKAQARARGRDDA